MSSTTKEKILFTVSVAAAGLLTRKLLTKSWEAGTGRAVPTKTSLRDGDWKAIVAWTAASGAVVGFSRLVALEGARRVAEGSSGNVLDEAAADAEESVEV